MLCCLSVPRVLRNVFLMMALVGLALCGELPARAVGDGVETRWAVIVGIADYDGTVNDLDYCDDDAIAVRQALLADARWQEEGRIALLTDAQATKAAIYNAMTAMADAADEDDLCLFFFSGHGGNAADVAPLDEADQLDEYLCPYDLNTQMIRDDELADWLAALPTPQVRVLIDSCFSGGMTKSLTGKGKRARALGAGHVAKGDGFMTDVRARLATRAARDLNTSAGLVCLMACDDTELSWEESALGHGVFTYYLLQGLALPTTDTDGNGEFSLEETHAYLAPLTAQRQPTQHPQLYDGNGDAAADFVGLELFTLTDLQLQDTAGNGNASGYWDPGERVTLTLTLKNACAVSLTGITAELIADDPRVTVYQGASAFPDLPAAGSAANTTPFLLGLDLDAATAPVALSLRVATLGRVFSLPVQAPIGLAQPVDLYTDTLESGIPGWTHAAAAGLDTWALVTTANDTNAQYAHSPTHCWHAANNTAVSDQRLVTPGVPLPSSGRCVLTFYHTFEFEEDFDGAVLEISTDDGATFTDLGAYLTEGGYNTVLSDVYGNPLGGAPAWSGGVVKAMTRVCADLSDFAGHTVRLRFRVGTDTSYGGAGWYLDDLTITAEHTVTQSVAALQITSPRPAGPSSPAIAMTSPGSARTRGTPSPWNSSKAASCTAPWPPMCRTTAPTRGRRRWRCPMATITRCASPRSPTPTAGTCPTAPSPSPTCA